MKTPRALAANVVLLLVSCTATRDVVETSYHVATAPVRLVHRAIAGDDTPPPTAASDVEVPGRPVPPSYTPRSSREASTEYRSSRQSSEPSTSRSSTTTSSSRNAAAQSQFPTAKPVPGKSGLVYNPYDPSGAYIDVSGYAPGSKVKDPDTQKIFIVP